MKLAILNAKKTELTFDYAQVRFRGGEPEKY